MDGYDSESFRFFSRQCFDCCCHQKMRRLRYVTAVDAEMKVLIA